MSKIENDRAAPSPDDATSAEQDGAISASPLLNKDLVEPWTILRRGECAGIGHAWVTGSEGVKADVLSRAADGRLREGVVVVIEPGGHTVGIMQQKDEGSSI